jgi:hypothetical protein
MVAATVWQSFSGGSHRPVFHPTFSSRSTQTGRVGLAFVIHQSGRHPRPVELHTRERSVAASHAHLAAVDLDPLVRGSRICERDRRRLGQRGDFYRTTSEEHTGSHDPREWLVLVDARQWRAASGRSGRG